MITLMKIRWKNFLATGNEFNEILLDEYKNTLISGKNGSGKSTVMDALTFVLFGKAFRKVNKPQLLNSVTNKGALVEIDFKVGKTQYKVIRGMKPARFEIFKNGKFLEQSANSRDYQEELERNVLKINYKTFCQIVILGNANFTPFMELSPAARRNIVEDLLDIKIFSVMNTLLKEKHTLIKANLLKLEHDISLLKNTISLNEKHKDELQKSHEKTIKSKLTQITKTQKEIDKYNKAKAKVEEAKHDLEKKYEKYDELTEKISQLKTMQGTLVNKKQIALKNKNFYESHDQCPECEQQIIENFKENKIASFENIIDINDDKLKKIEESLDKLVQKTQKFIEMNEDINKYNIKINQINTEIASSNYFISSLQTEITELQSAPTKKNDSKEEKKALKDKLIEKEKLVNDRETMNIASLLLKDNGIKTQIVKQYIPIMNSLINKHLDELGFFCQFELDENFNETIKSRFRDEFSYSSFSEGEKMRINLALLFAWREIARMKNSSSINLLILDEIMDSSLDAEGTEEFLEIIRRLSGNNNIIVISHKHDQIVDKFDNTLKFEKHKNFSRLIA